MDTVSIIESVGCAHNPFGCYAVPFFEDGMMLNCFKQNPIPNNSPNNTSHCCMWSANAVPEIKNNFSFEIFPNPSSGNFTIILNGAEWSSPEKIKSFEIFDVLGNRIKKSEVKSQKIEIDLSNCKGIYLVKVMDENGNFSVKKIVLE